MADTAIAILVPIGVLLTLNAMARTYLCPALCLLACYFIGGLTMAAFFSASLIVLTILFWSFGSRATGHTRNE